ncbi:carboxymuconolactone decarboxylase family protein [Desulfovibrio sp. OttesenSCG-928-C14]|nr:carboxymuconolactone decarboxylase family protein [Desulfovibrio sp. OttesenSCG-928-C14]
MKNRILSVAAAALFCLAAFAAVTEAHAMNNTLNARQQSMVAISALSASGDLDNLKSALTQGLDAGVSVNEIKEILVQVYAYAGFPRSLNALTVFQTVVEERKARGISDTEGAAASPMPLGRTNLEFGTENQTKLIGQPIGGGIYDFAPAIDQFLKAHLFGDIFQRDNLDWKHRELATIAMLAAIPGVEPQLKGHMGIGMHNGLTVEDLRSAAVVVGKALGKPQGDAMNRLLDGMGK